MDDDLPKEGELLDISQNRRAPVNHGSGLIADTTPKKFPMGVVITLISLAAVAFLSQNFLGGRADPEQVAQYKQGNQSIFDTMKSQLPYLVSITCEGKDPNRADCVNFVGTFRPDKENPNYLVSMGSFDKVEGVSVSDMKTLQDNLKVLVDNKRMTLSSVHAPLTFLVDSVTVPRIGEEFSVKVLCTEDGANIITCEPKR